MLGSGKCMGIVQVAVLDPCFMSYTKDKIYTDHRIECEWQNIEVLRE